MKDITKLPRWAQDQFIDMQRQIEFLNRKIEEVSSSHPDTNVRIGRGVREPDFTLPPNSGIMFRVVEGGYVCSDSIEVRHSHERPGHLMILGDQPVVIHPGASNYFEVSFRDRT